MGFELEERTIVIVADAFNPALINQYWLIKNDIIDEKEVILSAISSPQVSNLKTDRFSILIIPKQLQFGINPTLTDDLPYNRLTQVLASHGYIPITALGINFKWKQDSSGEALSRFTREYYRCSNEQVMANFNDTDARFGLYLSKDFKDSRLKLHILPVKSNSGEEYVQWSFNFHHEINPDTDFDKVLDQINNWKVYYDEAELIINSTKS